MFQEQAPWIRDVKHLVGCGPAQALVCGPYLNTFIVSSVDNKSKEEDLAFWLWEPAAQCCRDVWVYCGMKPHLWCLQVSCREASHLNPLSKERFHGVLQWGEEGTAEVHRASLGKDELSCSCATCTAK